MAETVASLGFDVDTAGLEKGSRALDDFASSGGKVPPVVDDLTKAIQQNTVAVGNLGKVLDQSSAQHEKHGKAANDNSKELGKLAEIISYLHLRLIDQAKSIGFLGTVLTALGPVGLAAGVAMATFAAALLVTKRAADELSEKATKLHDLSQTTGLTTDKLQELQRAGESVGLSSDRVSTFLTAFTVRIDQLRKGSGPLYDALLKIDQSLAAQATGAKTTEQAINILRAAYQKANDEIQRNALITAAGGRGSAEVGRIFGAGADASTLGILTNDQIDRWSKMRNEIEAINSRTKDIFASMFTDEVLQKEKQFAEFMERTAIAMREVNEQKKGQTWGEWIRGILATPGMSTIDPFFNKGGGMPSPWTEQEKQDQIARHRRTLPPSADDRRGEFGPMPESLRTPKESPEAESERLKRNIAVLGEAATAEELLTSRQKELTIQVKAGQIAPENATRAMQAYRVSLSGVEEGVRQTLGIATFTDLWTQKIKELDLAAKKYNLTQEQYNTAVAVGAEQTRKAAEAQEVMRSRLPGLTQLNIDSRDLAKNLDTLGMSSINAVSSGLTDMLMGTTTLSAGFKNLSLSVVKALDEMAVKMLVVAPLVQLMKSSLSAFLPNVQLPGSNADISAGIRQQHSGGMVGAGGVFVRANPAIFLGAPRLHGGLASDEFPAILQRGERVLSKREVQQGSGNGPAVQINFTNAHPTAKVSQSSKNVGGKRIINVMVAEVGSAAARGDMDSAFGGRFGAKPRQITR